jgi:hypothetical protein
MRRELLGHLQAALEEERGKTGDEAVNETGAIERAKRRLGEPAQLTRELQRSVPLLERVMLAKVPGKWGVLGPLAGRLGFYDAAAVSHWLILYGSGAIAVAIICLFSPHVAPDSLNAFFVANFRFPHYYETVLVVAWLMQIIWFYTGIRFLSAVAAPPATFRPMRVIREGLIVLLSQGLLMVLIIGRIVFWPATLSDFQSLGVCAMLLCVVAFVGRRVAAMRRPYDEWLTLDLTR